jgi:hypothetical protein
MPTLPIVSCVEEIAVPCGAHSNGCNATIRCYAYSLPFTRRQQVVLSSDRKLAAQVTTLLMGLDREFKYARAGDHILGSPIFAPEELDVYKQACL